MHVLYIKCAGDEKTGSAQFDDSRFMFSASFDFDAVVFRRLLLLARLLRITLCLIASLHFHPAKLVNPPSEVLGAFKCPVHLIEE